ncbi:PREDICTED: uncharacterized protein LOC106331004 [Brassica oleracea var. oleracea]|nr:PREDICTED: uncharacterized protein LOC106331004 [Brassica oleracea var. oleracea]
MGLLDLEKHFAFYGAYHSNPINIVIHICLDKKSGEESGFEETHIVESVSWDDLERNAASKAGGCSKRHHSWRSHQHDSSRKDDESPGDLYELWRQEQNIIAARLDKELKSRWELDELIEEQLSRYQSHYFKTMVSTSLKDVSNLLMPTWIPPHELAAVSWLGYRLMS